MKFTSSSCRVLPLLAIMTLMVGLTTMTAADENEDALKKKVLKLNQITGEDAMKGQLRSLLKDEAETKKLLAAVAKMVKEAKEDEQPLNFTSSFILARAAHGLKVNDTAKQLYMYSAEQAAKLRSANKFTQAYERLLELCTEIKEYDEAIKFGKKFLEAEWSKDLGPNRLLIVDQMIRVMGKQKKFEEAHKLADGLLEEYPNAWLFHELKASLFREEEKFEDAAKMYGKAIDALEDNNRIEKEEKKGYISGMRYLLSGVYVDAKMIEKASEQLEILVREHPENATFHNDLGFILADHDMRLDDAEKYIRKAIELDRERRKKIEDLPKELDKDNAAYLDSLGWVLYKKKDYKEAKKYLLEATTDKEGAHVEIYDHLADVHLALGEKKEARETYEKALKLENISKRDDARKKKITEKLKKLEMDN